MAPFNETAQKQKVLNAMRAARKQFPNKCNKPDEKHHFSPKYLGGDLDGPTVSLPALYHRLITNVFRDEWGYGQ